MSIIEDEYLLGEPISIKAKPSWRKWFAWKPVYIRGEKFWMQSVYRRERDMQWPHGAPEDPMHEFGQSPGWKYGTIFDVLKD